MSHVYCYLTNLKTLKKEKIKFNKRICLIGSSGVLLGKNYGSKIDAFKGDICRMNSSCISGFENDVGKKCDYRIVSYIALKEMHELKHKLGFNNESNHCKLILWGANQHKATYFHYLLKICRKFPQLKVYEIDDNMLCDYDNAFEKFIGVHRQRSGAWLSTGWVTLCFFIKMDCKIRILGLFGNGQTLYHYWNVERGNENSHYTQQQFGKSGHRFMTEHEIFKNVWPTLYDIKFIL